MLDLIEIRKEIDQVDREIVKLFESRMEMAKNVAEFKKNSGKHVFDKQREEDKLKELTSLASNEFNKHGIEELFTQIMSMSRKLQYGLLSSMQSDSLFEETDGFNITDKTKVVFFGVKGSHTEQAMEEYFGMNIESIEAPTFKNIMEMIIKGHADYGVLPIENSSTGGITDIYDLLVEYDNYIVAEHVIKVDQALLGLEGSQISMLQKVYSHPQGLLQCSKFLDANKNIKPMEYPSTAASALKIIEDQDITQGAIASKRAAKYYGLTILDDAINFNTTNSTRFIIISNKKTFLKQANKISICFELPHESGTLYNMLSHFIYNNLSMTKIESRPLGDKKWEYRFFVDFEGNLNDPGVKNALAGIREEATNMKVLGNF